MPRYPALAVSASLLSTAQCFAGFAFAKAWLTALPGQDLLAKLPLKAKESVLQMERCTSLIRKK